MLFGEMQWANNQNEYFFCLDYSELIQYLSSIDDGSFAHYLLLEVVLEAIRFKKKFVIHSLRSSSQFGTKIEKILYVNSLNEDGQKVGR